MKLPAYTIWIFLMILLLLLLLGLFPSAQMIGIAVMLSTILMVYQVYLILKDEPREISGEKKIN